MLYDKWVKEWKSALAENFFLRVLCLVLALAVVINVVFFRSKDRIIIVPPKVEKAMWVEQDRISDAYLEQMGVFFATFAGNMSPVNAEYNAKILTEHTVPTSNAEHKNEIRSQGAYFKKNNITQAFFPESVKVDSEKKYVSVEGQAIRYVGSTKVSQERVIINVRFKLKDYNMKIDELYLDYPERAKKQSEEKEKTEKKKQSQKEKEEKEKEAKDGI